MFERSLEYNLCPRTEEVGKERAGELPSLGKALLGLTSSKHLSETTQALLERWASPPLRKLRVGSGPW